MHDFDLIPASWRHVRRTRRALMLAGLAYLAIGMGLAYGMRLVHGQLGDLKHELDASEAGNERVAKTMAMLDDMRAQLAARQAEHEALRHLSAGVAVPRLFATLDRALSERITLVRWHYRRDLPRAARNRTDGGSGADSGAAIAPAMLEIEGVAQAHTDLARFVDALTAQEEVRKVGVVSTARTPDGRAVNFALHAHLDTTHAAGENQT